MRELLILLFMNKEILEAGIFSVGALVRGVCPRYSRSSGVRYGWRRERRKIRDKCHRDTAGRSTDHVYRALTHHGVFSSEGN